MFRCIVATLLLLLTPLVAKEKAKAVQNARQAASKIAKLDSNLKLKRSHIMQTALFLEKKSLKRHYMPRSKTGLKHTIECDRKTKSCFIVLENKKAFLGEGACKKVYKAIYYDKNHPKVVARATQRATRAREHTLTQQMHGKPGLFKTVGFAKNWHRGKRYSTIYSQVYRPGSLHNALEKKVRLSSYEKMKIAADMLSGLRSLHEEGIVHRDLGARNYLVDIPKGKPGRRNVHAAIADLGRATPAARAAKTRVQGNTKYTAPEALQVKKMRGKDYYKSDIFAVGCVLHWLYYGKQPSWQDRSYVQDVSGSSKHRFHKLRWRVNHAIKKRRTYLAKNRANLKPIKQFELLILNMLHTKPHKRTTAKQLSLKMDAIFAQG